VAEWVRDTSGTALKTTDWILDVISELLKEREQLKADLLVAMECALVR